MVESIDVFVVDICVVAEWNDLSQFVTRLMANQSSVLSSKAWSSLFLEAKLTMTQW